MIFAEITIFLLHKLIHFLIVISVQLHEKIMGKSYTSLCNSRQQFSFDLYLKAEAACAEHLQKIVSNNLMQSVLI